jgi:hypothetical protein
MKRFVLSTALVLSTLAAVPAHAGGSISFEITPKNAEEETAIRVGLAFYAIAKAIEGDAAVIQNGNGNAAGIGQFGSGNFGVIEQDGDGHEATLTQNGNGNAYGVFQFGEGGSAHVNQNGNGQAGLLFQVGWR